MSSLRAFAEAHTNRRGPQCWTCRLPVALLNEIRAEAKRGTSFNVVSDWLRSKGHRIGGYSLAKHFREHERKG